MSSPIDETDSRIIQLLKTDGRLPNTEIAKQLGISETTVRKRLKRLLAEDFIQIVAVGNRSKLGYGIVGNLKLHVDIQKAQQVAEALKGVQGIWYIARLTGAVDFDLEFSFKSQQELRALMDRITRIDGVTGVETSMRLELIKNRYDWETPP